MQDKRELIDGPSTAAMSASDDMPPDLSPQEVRVRKVIEALLSRPVIMGVGGGSVYYATVGLPDAVAAGNWMLAVFNLVEFVVGSLCLVMPGIETLRQSCRSMEEVLHRAHDRLKRIFPDL